MLIDEAKIHVQSGKGGDGLVSFRREKYVPLGGPSGGDGGKGGDVILRATRNLNSLYFFKKNPHFKAESGKGGGSSNKTGASASDLIIDVPRGTIVRKADSGEIVADLVDEGDQVIVAVGGRGGRGNSHFATSANRAPRVAEKGAPNEELWITLELKLIADVGLIGVPNAGKSTLLSVVSNATPKVADYPFTTLEPNLGVVTHEHRDLVWADIPGLIEGAHLGQGLGFEFLRHVQRTRVLVHLLDGGGEDPLADFNQINTELTLFDEDLMDKPQIVVLNKMDLPDAQFWWDEIASQLRDSGHEPLAISAVTHENVSQLIARVFELVESLPEDDHEDITYEDTVYELSGAEQAFEIIKNDDGSFSVVGSRIERAAAMTYWEYDEAVNRFHKILDVIGVLDALRSEGVQQGDTVYIGEHELEWSD